jgi:hypothetical protein
MAWVAIGLTGCSLANQPLIGIPGPSHDPQAIYNALLNNPFKTSELPAGFSSPGTTANAPDDYLLKFNVLGGVEITMKGPDAYNFINYWVYPTTEDAKKHFESHISTDNAYFASTSLAPYPAVCAEYLASAGDGRYGATYCKALVGSVEVFGVSWIESSTRYGDADNAVQLALAGIAHLNSLLK